MLVETFVVHLLLYPKFPMVALGLLCLSAAGAIWLVDDHRAFSHVQTRLSPSHLHLRVSRRATADLPREAISSAGRPSWKDVPTDSDALYLNASAPAEPNVLIHLHAAQPVRLTGGFRKQVLRIGVCFDDPDAFLAALADAASATDRGA